MICVLFIRVVGFLCVRFGCVWVIASDWEPSRVVRVSMCRIGNDEIGEDCQCLGSRV